MPDLATRCPCGHTANYHPSLKQQASGGRECKGGTSVHCRCITDRERVIASATSHHPRNDETTEEQV